MQETHLEAAKVALPLLLAHTSSILTALVAADDAVAHLKASATFQTLPDTSKSAFSAEPHAAGGPQPSPRGSRNSAKSPRSTRHSTAAPAGAATAGGGGGGRVWTWQRARGTSSMDASGMEFSSADGNGGDRQRSASMHVMSDTAGGLGSQGDAEGGLGDRVGGETILCPSNNRKQAACRHEANERNRALLWALSN